MATEPTAPAPSPHSTLSPVEREVQRIRALIEQGRFAEALAGAEAQIVHTPENRDFHYMRAVCLRYLQRVPEALAALERLERTHPGFSRLYQERGHCYVTLRDAPQAIEAYQKAVNRNPALTASWAKLEVLYRMTGKPEQAANAAAHLEVTGKLPAPVLTATGLLCDGDLAEAELTIRPYLMQHPTDVEAMRLLAKIALERDVVQDADVLLAAVLELAPDYAAARFDYARALLRRHKYAPALAELDKLLRTEPDNRVYRTTQATAFVGIGDHERALAQYRQLLEETPQNADLHLSVAHTLKTLGRTAEAIEEYHAAATARPGFGDAYWSLANLKTYRFADAEIETMRVHEASDDTRAEDRYHLCFALGKAYEDRAEYRTSFDYYERGNALKKAEGQYDPAFVERNTALQKEVCSRELFERRRGAGCPAPDPIFIVGLPRSGSTLLEQILASHSRVEGTMELAEIASYTVDLEGENRDASDRRYPRVLAELAPEELRRLGERYLADTRVYRSGRPFFIDKMPNNFRHIGFIHLILPNAKIIDARREPMACCFSNFKQLFASGQEFTYGLEDIARYYRTYVELMAHWDEVLPGRVLRVQHEQVVEDLDGSVRRILDYCGLEFEPGCLEFHRTERTVRTASSEQVRRPINREGLDQWRHYEPWLGPLREALGPLCGASEPLSLARPAR
ncbi:MAG: sulfotransferase [Gammaproteobacteria bacterium]|nr:sulfotransferase [Gammaproteobacteria bacterium]